MSLCDVVLCDWLTLLRLGLYSPGWPWTSLLYDLQPLFSLLHLPSVGTAGMHHHTRFCVVLGTECKASCMKGKHPTNWAIASKLARWYFFFKISSNIWKSHICVVWHFQTRISQTICSLDAYQNQVILQKCGNNDLSILGLKVIYSVWNWRSSSHSLKISPFFWLKRQNILVSFYKKRWRPCCRAKLVWGLKSEGRS